MKAGVRDGVAASLLSIGALGSAALAFAVQAFLARYLPDAEYGKIAAALAIVTIVSPAFGFGVPSFWLKAYGTEGWMARRWMDVSVRFVMRNGLFCLLATVAWAWIGTRDSSTRSLLLAMLPAVLAQGAIEMASAKLQLEEQFGRVAMWQALQHGARLLLIVGCWIAGVRSLAIAVGFGFIAGLIAFGAWRSVGKLKRGAIHLVGHGEAPPMHDADERQKSPTLAELRRNVMPFGVANLLFYAYSQSGLIVVSHFDTPHDVGVFGVAVTVLNAIYLLPSVIFQKLYVQRFHRWAASGDVRLEQAYRVSSKWMFIVGVAVACSVAMLAPFAVPLIFGAQYAQAGAVVALMAASAPFRFLTISASSIMTTRHMIHVRNRCAAVALVFSVMGALLCALLAGIRGVAIASVAGEMVWALLSMWCVRRALLVRHRNDERSETMQQQNLFRPSSAADIIPVSVIIPCFNCGETINRAVLSVFNQTCRPRELILVDDCSTDGTLDILNGLAATYPDDWIRVIKQPRNAGPGAARNAAWALATEKYIAFLDSDDTWHPDKMSVQYGWMQAHPEVAITGHPVLQLERDESIVSGPISFAGTPQRVSRHGILFSNRFTPSSILMRADVSARFDEAKRYAEDYFMVLNVALVDGGDARLFPAPMSYIYKAQFGAETGLSAQLLKIQKGEQDNYLKLRERKLISNIEWVVFSSLSALKYLRRCILSRRFA